jgi:O-antigen/teichoic acid export membrane protein
MAPESAPAEPARWPTGQDGPKMSAVRTIARNTSLQAAAEMLGKLASVAYYAIMARKLGQEGFGQFTFALSLSLLTTVVTGFGIDAYVARAVARDPAAAPRLLVDALVVKTVFGTLGVLAAILVSLLGGYPGHVSIAVGILAVAAVLDLLTRAAKGTFQGLDDLRPVAAGLIMQRYATAIIGIVLLLAGGGLVAASLAYLAGMLLAMGLVFGRLFQRGIRPRGAPSLARSRRLVRGTLALGINIILNTALFRLDTVLLSFMKSDAAVGVYGAAYRLLESTLFLPFAFAAALLPTLSRLTRESQPTIGEATELGLKAVVMTMLPLGAIFVVFPRPIVDIVYGAAYDDAVTAVRLLGAATALYGVSYLSAYVFVGQGRQGSLPRLTALVLVFNVVANLLVIPRWSYDGAAAVTSASELLLAGLSLNLVVRTVGRLSVARILAGPVTGAVLLAGVGAVVGTGLVGLALGGVAYVAGVAIAELRFYPADLRRLVAAVRGRPLAEGVA